MQICVSGAAAALCSHVHMWGSWSHVEKKLSEIFCAGAWYGKRGGDGAIFQYSPNSRRPL